MPAQTVEASHTRRAEPDQHGADLAQHDLLPRGSAPPFT